VKELIRQLRQVDGDRTVWLMDGDNGFFDFSGIDFDDVNDVSLFRIPGDKEA